MAPHGRRGAARHPRARPDPRPTLAERLAAPLDFTRCPDGSPRRDLPCTQPDADPEAWFPIGSTGPAWERELQQAKARCRPCPVRVACRDYAVDNPGLLGVWGGTCEQERARMRRTA